MSGVDAVDWFERLTGFRESGYEATRSRLEVTGDRLRSRVNGRDYGIGHLELVSLAELRERVHAGSGSTGRLRVSAVSGDARRLHLQPGLAGALFQVASQFNLLEMVSPSRTPEDGVSGYAFDRTQGPACAIAAGAATLYRNYFVPVGDRIGQTADRQLDGLADLGRALAAAVGKPVDSLWRMTNGYACCTASGLESINHHLVTLSATEADLLRRALRIGLHWHVEVTDADAAPGPTVSQAFCSALPVAYGSIPPARWAPFATLVLEAAYEATMLAAICNARAGGSNVVLLTFLGGGAFGNDDAWIHSAMRRALRAAGSFDLDVRLVSFGAPPASVVRLAREFG